MALKVESVNLLALENSKAHKTHRFEVVHLKSPTPVFRRGEEFEFNVTFSNRSYDPKFDKLRVLFTYNDHKSEDRLQLHNGGAWVTNSQDVLEDLEMWSLRVINNQGKTLKLKMRSPITIPIGSWKMTIKTDLRSHLGRETYECPTNIYLLLNPWNKSDDVYMPDSHLLEEYVMNDVGKVYVGGKGSSVGRQWLFGQFEKYVLPIISNLIRSADLYYHEKGDPIQLSRITFSSHEILEGNWTGNYEDGTNPSMWTGTAPILKEYSQTGETVKYGQCWVFASLACTLCRAMGIPARVVTNVLSAQDYDDSLTVDKYFNKKGEYISFDSESIWNFHAWTDVWMARPDLPPVYGGWQAIDATSGNGPSPLEAVKRGEVGLEYDVASLIAEVNADVVDWIEDEDSLLGYKKIKTNTNYVGYKLLTKRPHIFDPNGERDQDDVMHLYKNTEGSKEERLALYKAAFKCSFKSCEVFDLEKAMDLTEIDFSIPESEPVFIGKSFDVVLDMKNTINEKRTVQVAVTLISVYYNGVKGHTVKQICENVELKPEVKKQFKLVITAEDYIGKLVEFSLLKAHIIAIVDETKQCWSGEADFTITKPNLTVQVDGPLKVGKPGKIIFKLKNPLKIELNECQLAFDCPGIMKYQKLPFRKISPEENVNIEANVIPTSQGKLTLVAVFHTKELQEIHGSSVIEVA